jgi:hypothetical protein
LEKNIFPPLFIQRDTFKIRLASSGLMDPLLSFPFSSYPFREEKKGKE